MRATIATALFLITSCDGPATDHEASPQRQPASNPETVAERPSPEPPAATTADLGPNQWRDTATGIIWSYKGQFNRTAATETCDSIPSAGEIETARLNGMMRTAPFASVRVIWTGRAAWTDFGSKKEPVVSGPRGAVEDALPFLLPLAADLAGETLSLATVAPGHAADLADLFAHWSFETNSTVTITANFEGHSVPDDVEIKILNRYGKVLYGERLDIESGHVGKEIAEKKLDLLCVTHSP